MEGQSVSWILAATGAVLLFAGITGGGFELKDLRVPKISNPNRVLCSVAGIALLVVVVLPVSQLLDRSESAADASNPDQVAAATPTTNPPPDAEPSPPEAPPVEVPPLFGETLEAATGQLEALGLAVRDASARKVWAPDGRVLEQVPEPGESVARGSGVELVLADSEVSYQAAILITGSDGDEIEATVDYRIKLIESDDQRQIGQFVMSSAEVSGAGAEFSQVMDRLRGEPGFVAMDAVEDLDLESAWAAYSNLGQEFGHEVAVGSIGEDPSFDALGPAMMLGLAGLEFEFDVKAMLLLVPAESERAQDGFDLQAGSELLSSIRIEGPPTVSGAGSAHRFNIVRRAPNEERFERIGSATYSVNDGLLESLNLMYTLTGDSGVYRLEIERQ